MRPARFMRPALVAAVAGLVGTAQAAQLVVLQDARTIIAQSVRLADGIAVLELGNGNEISMPEAHILELRPYVPPPPPLPVPAPGSEPATPQPGSAETGSAMDWRDKAGRHAPDVERAAARHGLDPVVIVAVALAESRFDRWALSRKGAQGVMQLMPGTARQLEVDNVWNAGENIDAGARWLKRLLEKYDGNLDLALAAYNAGEESVRKHGGIPPFPETVAYVRKVRETVARLRTARAAPEA